MLAAANAARMGCLRRGKERDSEAVRLTPDIILVDVSMPDMNGFEVANRIHDRLPAREILIVTAHDYRAFTHIGPRPGVRGTP